MNWFDFPVLSWSLYFQALFTYSAAVRIRPVNAQGERVFEGFSITFILPVLYPVPIQSTANRLNNRNV